MAIEGNVSFVGPDGKDDAVCMFSKDTGKWPEIQTVEVSGLYSRGLDQVSLFQTTFLSWETISTDSMLGKLMCMYDE